MVGASIVLLLSLGYVVVKRLNYFIVFGFSLFIGGGIGNLWDRVFNNGAVVDFMLIQIGPLKTGIFNVADVVIIIGGGMLIISSMFIKRNHITTK